MSTSKPLNPTGGKGSVRRNEDNDAYRDNYDAIFGRNNKKEKSKMEYTEDGDVICPQCGTEMSATEHGRWLHCDICGHTEDFIEDDNYDCDD